MGQTENIIQINSYTTREKTNLNKILKNIFKNTIKCLFLYYRYTNEKKGIYVDAEI